jgi:hypothetical protein
VAQIIVNSLYNAGVRVVFGGESNIHDYVMLSQSLVAH